MGALYGRHRDGEIRQALGDDPSNPTYIQTVARRGYRFIAAVEPLLPAHDTVVPAAAPVQEFGS